VHRGLDVSGINSKFDVKEGRVVVFVVLFCTINVATFGP
jgi:hypothetical protein